ncbi:uncharacterized protein LOC144113402 isoform X1 [Amblyomma americanum]
MAPPPPPDAEETVDQELEEEMAVEEEKEELPCDTASTQQQPAVVPSCSAQQHAGGGGAPAAAGDTTQTSSKPAMCRMRCFIHAYWSSKHQPDLCGITGNEEADELATAAHQLPPRDLPLALEDVRAVIHEHLQRQHPDPRIAGGERIASINGCRALSRSQRAMILCARIGCVWPGDRRVRHGLATSEACDGCGAVETLEHLLLRCTAFADACRDMLVAYRELGLLPDSLKTLLWPQGSARTRERTMVSLCAFLEQTGLTSCLFCAR